jgi:hypothetical protein
VKFVPSVTDPSTHVTFPAQLSISNVIPQGVIDLRGTLAPLPDVEVFPANEGPAVGSDPITGATLRLLVRSTLDSHGNVQTTQLGVEAIPRDQRGSASSPPLYLRVPSTNNQVAQVKGAVSVNVAGRIPMVDLVDAVVLP